MALCSSSANDKVENCSCCYGKLRVLYDESKVKLVWTLPCTLVTDVMWLASDWCYTEKSECRLFTTVNNGAIDLALMSRNRSEFGYTIRMGLLTDSSEEIYSVSSEMPPLYSFQKTKLCSLPEFNREVVNGKVQFFCEINMENLSGTSTMDVEQNPEGQSSKTEGARLKDSNTKPKEVNRGQTMEAVGSERISKRDLERNKRAEETGLPSKAMGAKPKESQNARRKEIVGETIQTYDAARIARKDAEKTKKTEEAGTSTADFEEKAEGWSKSTGAKPKVQKTVPQEIYGAEVIQTSGTAEIDSDSDEFQTAEEPGEGKNEGSSSDDRIGESTGAEGVSKREINEENRKQKKISVIKGGVDRMIENFRNLLKDEWESDVVLKTNDHKFHAHRIILRARSPVFASMFEHEMKEKTTGEVDISDCSTIGFEVFLEYLYTASVESMSADNALDVLYIADKYHVDDLKTDCVKFLEKCLSVDNFCDIIPLLRHSELDLQKAVTQFFCLNAKTIIKTVKWQRYLCEYPIQANELYMKAINA